MLGLLCSSERILAGILESEWVSPKRPLSECSLRGHSRQGPQGLAWQTALLSLGSRCFLKGFVPNPRLRDGREARTELLAGGLWLLGGILPLAAPSLQHHLNIRTPVLGKLRQQLPSRRGYRRGEVPASVRGRGPASALDQLLHPSGALCGTKRSCHVGFAARGGGERDPGKNLQPVKQTEQPLREAPSPFSSLQWK